MPWELHRYQQCGQLHFITFSCYRRQPLLATPRLRNLFETVLEQTRRSYGFSIAGYVVMPEHVHLLMSEPERGTLATALQSLKQASARRSQRGAVPLRWQARYYDFNVFRNEKRIEKLRYMHRNPVKRGLVDSPEEWEWSSFRHYLTGEPGRVTIDSPLNAMRNEKRGIVPRIKKYPEGLEPKEQKQKQSQLPRPSKNG